MQRYEKERQLPKVVALFYLMSCCSLSHHLLAITYHDAVIAIRYRLASEVIRLRIED